MSDALLHTTDRQEALSLAYIQAVAAGAGYATAYWDFDRDSIDIEISAGGNMRPKIGIQAKASTNLKDDGEFFTFPLPIKNYNDLRAITQTPRILVVLYMPNRETSWLRISVKELMIRRAAYWVSLRHQPESDNETSVSVKVPKFNLFDVNALRTLMERSRRGDL